MACKLISYEIKYLIYIRNPSSFSFKSGYRGIEIMAIISARRSAVPDATLATGNNYTIFNSNR